MYKRTGVGVLGAKASRVVMLLQGAPRKIVFLNLSPPTYGLLLIERPNTYIQCGANFFSAHEAREIFFSATTKYLSATSNFRLFGVALMIRSGAGEI